MPFTARGRAALGGLSLLLTFACGSPPPTGSDGTPAPTAEFKVAQPSALTEEAETVALAADGGFAVGWVATSRVTGPSDRPSSTLRARRFDVRGRALGDELVIRPESSATLVDLRLAFDTRGGLVAAWAEEGGIFGRRYAASGAAVGAPFALRPGAATDIFALDSVFITDASDAFVVFWRESDRVRPGLTLFGRRFTTDGVPLAERFAMVPGADAGVDITPTVAPRDDGRFAVVWERFDPAGAGSILRGQIASSQGAGTGPVFSPDVPPRMGNHVTAVTPQADGVTAVVWSSSPAGGRVVTPVQLLLQRFDAGGAALGPPVMLRPPSSRLFPPRAVAGRDPFLVVAWSEPDSSGREVPMAQRYDATGAPQGAPVALATMAEGQQFDPVLAADGAGNFVAAWHKQLTNESKAEVWARRFAR
jgi:hypothetical protein